MQGIFVCVAIFAAYLLQHTDAYCCFRDPLMLTPKCGCSENYTPCGVIQCPSCTNTGTKDIKPACSSNTCGCGSPVMASSMFCDCGLPCCSSFRDTSNVCFVCDQPSPMCSCLRSIKDIDCGCEQMKSFIYFPEVEYPVVATEMRPFFYAGCYSY